MEQPILYFARIRNSAVLPAKRDEDAGYDIFADLQRPFQYIAPMQTASIPTGIASACPAGYYFQIQERGSTGSRGIAKRCGVIDSGYRGEWFLPITNLNPKPLFIARPSSRPLFEKSVREGRVLVHYTDKALAQAILLRVPEADLREISYEQLHAIPSCRGDGALGSTDIK